LFSIFGKFKFIFVESFCNGVKDRNDDNNNVPSAMF
jgi:hypothetical protein